jgi:DNA-binding response OmpR family regulator
MPVLFSFQPSPNGSTVMPSTKGRILCTEDDLDTRDMLTKLLRDAGYDVVSPTDATQALTLALEEQFDLLLLDNWMPGLSGIDLTRELRKQNRPCRFCFALAQPQNAT